jgi:glycosyltransferase involved in cell wall biosynthesis
MSKNPDVSVVMSVYNGSSNLTVTMDSILSQEGVELEFIIVNDGSTDKTGEVLDDYVRRDDRVRVIHQGNTGLTCALIRGCAAATGEFIARQDAGDVSLAGRLALQLNVFRNNSNVVLTSCGTRFVGPGNEVLYEVRQVGDELYRGLQLDIGRIHGPSSHTSVMFRRETYEKVGGYRSQFNVAQDLDLWMRLAEAGICWATPEILCEFHLSKNSIGAVRRYEQIRSAKVIVQCAVARRSGRDDSALVAKWGQQRKWNLFSWWWVPRRLQEAKFYYFIGSALRHRQPKQAQLYFWRAVTAWFPYPRAWYGILRVSGRR